MFSIQAVPIDKADMEYIMSNVNSTEINFVKSINSK